MDSTAAKRMPKIRREKLPDGLLVHLLGNWIRFPALLSNPAGPLQSRLWSLSILNQLAFPHADRQRWIGLAQMPLRARLVRPWSGKSIWNFPGDAA